MPWLFLIKHVYSVWEKEIENGQIFFIYFIFYIIYITFSSSYVRYYTF